MARVHILGNSIAHGFNTDSLDWPSLVKNDANRRRESGEKPRISIVNLASPGNMLSHVLDSGIFEASVKCNRRGRQLGVFCVGSCEASILRSRGETEPRRSQTDFRRDLGRLAKITEQLNSNQPLENNLRVILMGTLGVNNTASRLTPEGDDFSEEIIQEYDALMKNHAEMENISYVDLHTGFDSTTMLSNDGIHPNQEGDAFIYAKVMPVILSKLDMGDIPYGPSS